MDNYIFPLVIFIREILYWIKGKDMEKCFGMMVVFIKANGKMEFSMVKGKYI